MHLHKLYITLFFHLIWRISSAQQYTNYTTQNGLPSNYVYSITQDKQGLIWFITDKGMVKYDGKQMQVFTTREGLPTNDIWGIKTSNTGKVWFFTRASKLGYIENDSVHTFTSSNAHIINPIIINQVNDNFIVGNGTDWYTFHHNKWDYMAKPTNNTSIQPVISSDISELKLNNNTTLSWKNKATAPIEEDSSPTGISQLIFRGQVNANQFFFIAKNGYGVFNFSQNQYQLHLYPTSILQKNQYYTRFHQVNGSVQLSGENFLLLLQKDGSIKDSIAIPAAINTHFSFLDKSGNLWMATSNEGVYKISEAQRKNHYLLIGEKIMSINRVNNQLIINVFKKGLFTYYPKNKKIEPFWNTSNFLFKPTFIPELNTAFFPGFHEIIIQKGANEKEKKGFPENNGVNEIARQVVFFKNFLYGQYSFGINRLDKQLNILKTWELSGVGKLFPFRDRMFIATSDGVKELLTNDSIVHIGLKEKDISTIKKISDRFALVCTEGFGAFITDFKQYTYLPKSDFLSVQDACIYDDKVWLATEKGILLYQAEQDQYHFVNQFTKADGLPADKINTIYYTDNQLIVGTDNGMGIYEKPLQKKNNLLNLFIKKALFNTKILHPSDQILYAPDSQTSFQIQQINFGEHAPDFHYFYQLLPIQKKQSDASSDVLIFNNLQPNSYTLHIQSGTHEYDYNFTILPLWYQKKGIKTVFILGGFLLIFGLLWFARKRELSKKTKKLRIEKQLTEYELYALRSHMNPHFVFNSLQAIQYYLNDNKVDLSEKYLVRFSKLIRMFFDFSQVQNISIQEEIVLLSAYLEIEKMRFGEKLDYAINLDKKLKPEIEIPSMLLQPLVENAVNHGIFHQKEKGMISIHFQKKENNNFEIRIEDNGIGLEKSMELNKTLPSNNKTNSTLIIHNRIDLLNKSSHWHIEFTTEDLKNKGREGTLVTLVFTHQKKKLNHD